MARLLNRIVTRMVVLAAATTIITMLLGMAAYVAAVHYRLSVTTHHMPPKAREQLELLVRTHQEGSDRYFDLFDRYGAKAPALTDLGFVATIALVSILVGGGVAMVFARRISRPITAVANAAARVSAGDRSVRVERGSTSGETGELIESFNRMAADIDAYERERTVLTAGIAHELRTPLTILKGRLHGLADGVIDPATGEADRLLRQVEHLSHLVEDLRTLAHADAGELDLDRRPVDLAVLLGLAVGDLRGSASERDVTIVESCETALVHGDPVRLMQVMTNILTNAIKHAPDRSRIDVAVFTASGHAIVSVTDEGDGFAIDDEARMFMPFWRAGSDRLAGRPGSGVGLTLAAKITEAHGGRIMAKNRVDRSGACFSVWLPL
ncbi:cell wall metabolism sensor histidine kinase WalK [Sphingomonas sp. OK281]|uniref:sensor histidine kinase n=1 Tax=Sphingomonas sp. OK281 TaxID=1881067 RepID=UPI0008E3D289|nr:HAMP domain-containing sensor histidine kinase [Sphingomonas sp. OK281]SFN86644.1 two-component system, OmpR family, sensor histidine kinase BaeS/two-component system, OmpR family, sensor histidine kinase AdeS [Sphingomonas sp. OK281]